jgi:hypothetical protein
MLKKADGADWQPIQARVRPFNNPPFSDSFSPPRSQGGSSGRLVRSSSFSGVWRSLGLRQPAAAFPRQPCCRRSLQAAGKPLRYRELGNVMAKWSHGMLDGQQAGLPKAAAGCRSPSGCPCLIASAPTSRTNPKAAESAKFPLYFHLRALCLSATLRQHSVSDNVASVRKAG